MANPIKKRNPAKRKKTNCETANCRTMECFDIPISMKFLFFQPSILRQTWRIALCLAVLRVLFPMPVSAQTCKVAVLKSRNIMPYVQAEAGLSKTLEKDPQTEIRIYLFEKFREKGLKILKDEIINDKTDILIAVGPRAARFMLSDMGDAPFPKLYTMVLNPESLVQPTDRAIGISLNIPVDIQVRKIAGALPSVKRLGLLHDPGFNKSFFEKAAETAMRLDLEIVPLEVAKKKEIPAVLGRHWRDIDGLWLIPDRTVISDTIVKDYIMKEAILKNMPVIGYNRFFYRSGAALAFVFDYEELGIQTALMARDILDGKAPGTDVPRFHVWLNFRVIKKLGIRIPKGADGFEEGP